MKNLFLALLFTMSFTAQATVDANINVFILVEHVQSGEFFVQRAPVIGCFGLAKGPELAQLTAPYEVASNLGCGNPSKDNLNVLVCAKVLEAVEDEDYSTFKSITLDISKCAAKDDAAFIDGVKKVIKINFATKAVKNPELKLIK